MAIIIKGCRMVLVDIVFFGELGAAVVIGISFCVLLVGGWRGSSILIQL